MRLDGRLATIVATSYVKMANGAPYVVAGAGFVAFICPLHDSLASIEPVARGLMPGSDGRQDGMEDAKFKNPET